MCYDIQLTHTHTHNRFDRLVAGLLTLSCVAMPMSALAQEASSSSSSSSASSYEQHFTITAYYSPLPNQCCYVKGSYEADKILNGNGTHGSDGTPVYPGMLAAPQTYAFGTVIELPGIGVLTVHDRGGAIVEGSDTHRLDIWMGSGEEGLARALAFGIRRVTGIVHPVGTDQPETKIDLSAFAAPVGALKAFAVPEEKPALQAEYGSKGDAVSMLQKLLKQAGYFMESITGFFGDKTKASLIAFESDMGISGSGTSLSDVTSIYLRIAAEMKKREPAIGLVQADSSRTDVANAQRLLRFLGYYRGRTNGVYSDALFDAILALQKDFQLVGDASSPGAGRIGPLTRGVIVSLWQRGRIQEKATQEIELAQVKRLLADRGLLLDAFVSKGQSGDVVRALQAFLATEAFFPKDKINGVFGDLTAEAVTKYQIARELIESERDQGAGNVGPATLRVIQDEQVADGYKTVRSHGWNAL